MSETSAQKFNSILDDYLGKVMSIEVKSILEAKDVVNLLRECQYALIMVDFKEKEKMKFLDLEGNVRKKKR